MILYRLVFKTANMIKTANKPKIVKNPFNSTLFSGKNDRFEHRIINNIKRNQFQPREDKKRE